METGSILHIDSRGRVQVQLADRTVAAQIMQGGGQAGDLVNGPMEPGIHTWVHAGRQMMIVQVHPPTRAARAADDQRQRHD
jgi:hypothetical protein